MWHAVFLPCDSVFNSHSSFASRVQQMHAELSMKAHESRVIESIFGYIVLTVFIG